MNFTEFKEINRIIQNNRAEKVDLYLSTHNADAIPIKHDDTIRSYKDETGKNPDYEEILYDSPTRAHPTSSPFLEDTSHGSSGSKDESIDDILHNINELYKQKVLLGKRVSHKKGASMRMLRKRNSRERIPLEQLSLLRRRSNPEINKPVVARSDDRKLTSFGKIDENSLEKFSRRRYESSLSKSLIRLNFPRNKEGYIGNWALNSVKNRHIQVFRVYFFNTPTFLDIPINTEMIVADVIKQIYDYYCEADGVDSSLLKYPRDIDAYELRILDDEEAEIEAAHLPDFSIPSLEPNRVFGSLGLERGVAFVENPNYHPPESNEDVINKIRFMKSIAHQKNKILVRIHSIDEKFKTTLQIDQGKQVKDLYPLVAVKVKNISEKFYEFKLYKGKNSKEIDQELSYDKDHLLEDEDILNNSMPLDHLVIGRPNFIELEIVRKKFVDDPVEFPKSLKLDLFKDAENSGSLADTTLQTESHEIILYNEVTASHYEEFTVIKLNKNGEKSTRILGIDGFKIYNLFKKLEGRNLEMMNVLTSLLYSKITPKNKERLIKDVIQARIVNGVLFSIEFQVNSGRRKSIDYIAADRRSAYMIVSKIQYLKKAESRRIDPSLQFIN